MEGPEGLEAVRERLKKLIRDRIEIDFDVSDFIEKSRMLSQMYGNPYFKAGETWPENPVTGDPMAFIFQIFDSEESPLPDGMDLLQFFYDPEAMPWSADEPGWLIKTYESADEADLVPLEKPVNPYLKESKPLTAKLKFSSVSSLPRFQDLWDFDRTAQDMLNDIEMENEGEDAFDLYDSLCHELGADPGSSGIGGYPHWWQDEEYPRDADRRPYDLLVEINNGILWNRFGGFYLFSDREGAEKTFVYQCT